jgi:uncharacterized membrane protein
MMHRIQRVGVWQLAKVMGVLYFLMGIVFVGLISLFSRAMPGTAGTAFPGFGFASGIGMLFFMPLLYAFFGVVFGALTAALYNVVAGMMGGVEIDLISTVPSAPL